MLKTRTNGEFRLILRGPRLVRGDTLTRKDSDFLTPIWVAPVEGEVEEVFHDFQAIYDMRTS